jgi:hypothetical protein
MFRKLIRDGECFAMTPEFVKHTRSHADGRDEHGRTKSHPRARWTNPASHGCGETPSVCGKVTHGCRLSAADATSDGLAARTICQASRSEHAVPAVAAAACRAGAVAVVGGGA